MLKSESITNIAKAIGLFHTKMDKITKDASNPFYKSKYASLATILESIVTPMQECGLSYVQLPDGDSLVTILMHDSGEFFQSCYKMSPIPEYLTEKDRDRNVIWRSEATYYSPQSIGSALSYARRYAICAVLGLIVEDDDGNESSGKSTEQPEKKPESKAPPPPSAPKPEAKKPNLPPMTEKQFNQALDRVLLGEKEIYTKANELYTLTKDQQEMLDGALKSII